MPRPVIWENFDAYSNTDSLSGKSGGSGWDSNWSIDAGTVTISNAQAQSGKLSVKFGATSDDIAHRDLTILDNDQLDLMFYAPSSTNAIGVVELRNGGSLRFQFRCNYLTAGQLAVYDGGWSDVGAFNANAWNKVSLVLNASTGLMDVYLNEMLVANGVAALNSGSLTRIYLEGVCTGGNFIYFDSIQI